MATEPELPGAAEGPVSPEALPPELDGLFCEACGRDVSDVLDEDFFVPQEGAESQGYLSGRCARHPPEEPEHFAVVHIGGAEEEGEGR